MKAHECARELEITRAVLTRRLSVVDHDDSGDDLRAHADACPACRDAALVTAAFVAAREEALAEAHIPAAGQIWWRSALRAHAEAQGAARRPIIWLQGIAAACVAGLAAALLNATWPGVYDALIALAAFSSALRPEMGPLVDALRSVLPVAGSILGGLVLTSFIVYLALSDE